MQVGTGGRGRRGIMMTAAATIATIGLTIPAAAGAATAGSSAAAGSAAAGQARVPWSKVGPGWSLAEYSASQGGETIKPKAGPTTLYLVDPSGARYRLFTWAAHSRQTGWQLLAWSGDTKRAMFVRQDQIFGALRQQVFQLQLRTGAITSFRLPAHVSAVGYTRPDGLNILGARGANIAPTATGSLLRFSLTGRLLKRLATVRGLTDVAYQPRGGQLAAGGGRGITLISNAGGVIRQLPVPHMGTGGECSAVRWWSANTILASCSVANLPGPRMWLVPASGARPAALTPVRSGSSIDQGDFNAWQLSSGLYVDGVSACGTVMIGLQPRTGPERVISVPGSASSLIVNATRNQLQVERISGCEPGISLVWFNPATRALKVAVPVGHNEHGVIAVVPYFIAGKY